MKLKKSYVGARIDDDTKSRASEAPQFMASPLEVQTPNDTTLQAMAELDAGKGQHFSGIDDLMTDLKKRSK